MLLYIPFGPFNQSTRGRVFLILRGPLSLLILIGSLITVDYLEMGKLIVPDVHPCGLSKGGDGDRGADDEDIRIGLYGRSCMGGEEGG